MVRSGLTVAPAIAADDASSVGAVNVPALFLIDANTSLLARASAKSTYPMAPFVDFTICATPVFFCPACALAGHGTVSPEPSFHVDGAALARYFVNALVVPEPSARCTTTIGV